MAPQIEGCRLCHAQWSHLCCCSAGSLARHLPSHGASGLSRSAAYHFLHEMGSVISRFGNAEGLSRVQLQSQEKLTTSSVSSAKRQPGCAVHCHSFHESCSSAGGSRVRVRLKTLDHMDPDLAAAEALASGKPDDIGSYFTVDR